MNGRTRSIIGVVVMSALLLLYFAFAGVRAFALITSGTPIALVMGVALIVLPPIGVWALWRELSFGWHSTALIDELDALQQLPDDLGEASVMGKADRDAAESAFERYKADAEADPESWRVWARLGVVYDASGDRPRARAAMREAIALHRKFG